MRKLFFVLVLLVLFSATARACGCGLALADPKVFNDMKESNAFLVTQVEPDGSFYLKPFFRFVSLDKEENVTMVFPIKAIPKQFKADHITLRDFFENERIFDYEDAKEKQSLQGALNAVTSANVFPLFFYSIGFGGVFVLGFLASPFLFLGGMIGGSSLGASKGPVAAFYFEGGSLEIYDSSSDETLGELVQKIGYSYEGKVAELINKYSKNYVAVLQLRVPPALPQQQMNYFKANCGQYYEKAKKLLKQSGEIDLTSLGVSAYEVNGALRQSSDYLTSKNFVPPASDKERACKVLAVTFVSNAVGDKTNKQLRYSYGSNDGEKIKGVLLEMKFDATDPIFYPVSIVDSYNYPVSNQQYFVKVPVDKEAQFVSSYASQTALVGSTRWYEVKNTQQDLEVKIAPASIGTNLSDQLNLFYSWLYDNAFNVSLLLYVLSLFVVWLLLKKSKIKEKPPFWKMLLGGAAYIAYLLWNKDRKLAELLLVGIVIWLVLAII